MIQINGKDVSQIRVGNKIVTAVYIGAKLVWQSIRSCFGSGFWINSSPWKNDEGWKKLTNFLNYALQKIINYG